MQLLNDNQKRFYRLLAQYPRIAQYWDWEKREVDVERITADVPAMSHGEQLLAHFFVSVWLGKFCGYFHCIHCGKPNQSSTQYGDTVRVST